MKTYNRTCRCGTAIETNDHRVKLCPACREERYNARHPLKTCKKCGAETRDIGRNHRWCGACRRELEAQQEQARRAPVDQTRSARIDAFVAAYEQLPATERVRIDNFILQWIADRLLALGGDDVVDTHPEEQPHDNQAAIDAAFSEIMKGFEL